jgi:hypothetical protein
MGESPSKIERRKSKKDAPSKIGKEPSRIGRRPAPMNLELMRTLPMIGAPKRPDKPPAPRAEPPASVAASMRAGAPISPFDAPAPRTQVIDAHDARKALEQVARQRAAATAGSAEKTILLSDTEAGRPEAQAHVQELDTPSKIARRVKGKDGPSRIGNEPSKVRREALSKIAGKAPPSESALRPPPPPAPAPPHLPVAPVVDGGVPASSAPPEAGPSLVADLASGAYEGRAIADVTLLDADLRSARLAGSTWDRVDLTGAVLAAADLTGATLRQTTMRDVDLTGAKLERADLTGARVSSRKLDGADLRAARLRLADFTGVDLSRVQLAGARLEQCLLAEATGKDVSLRGCDLTRA